MGLFDRAYYNEDFDAMVEIAKGELRDDEHPCWYEEDGKLNVMIFRGYAYRRTFFNWREKMFADAWEEENRRKSLLNTLLGHDGYQSSQRDERIAAEIIQWLGTYVGWCFLERTLQSMGYDLKQRIATDRPDVLAQILTSSDCRKAKIAKRLIKVQYWCHENEQRIKKFRGNMERLLKQKIDEEIRLKAERIRGR